MHRSHRTLLLAIPFILLSVTVSAGDPQASAKLDSPLALEPPTRYPAADRVVAIGDLHGDLDAARAAFRLAGAIDKDDLWIGKDLVVVQLGDQLDRGGDELEILDLLESIADQAKAAGGKLITLNGNHELMNVKLDLRYVTVEGFVDFQKVEVTDPFEVSPQLVVDGVVARILAMRPGGKVALRMADRNVIAIVGDTVFVHGGVLPHIVDYGIERLNQETRQWIRGASDCPPPVLLPKDGPVWSRHYSDEPDEADCMMLANTLESLGAKRMIVAHTVQDDGITAACSEQVWRIDVGMAAHYGGSPEVLEIRDGKVLVLRQKSGN